MTTLWFTTRATGAIVLVLLTGTVVLGVASVGRLRGSRWPRFATDGVHRHLALLATLFLCVHILSAVLDSFAPISLVDAFVPFAGIYRPLWLGLGAVALDLLLAVGLTSLVRGRLGYRGWRAVHWLAYLSWPVALLHGLGTGSDARHGWMQVIDVVCVVGVLCAVLFRVASPGHTVPRALGATAAAAFVLGVIVWLPSGPYGSQWARRAGTPTRLLPAAERPANDR